MQGKRGPLGFLGKPGTTGAPVSVQFSFANITAIGYAHLNVLEVIVEEHVIIFATGSSWI